MAKKILLTICGFIALYSLFGAVSEVAGGVRVLPVVAPAALYLTHPVERNVRFENHAINAVVFGIASLICLVRRSKKRTQNA